jgi:hypothetical protein
MTVRELRGLLYDVVDQDAEVIVSEGAINTYSKLYSICSVGAIRKGENSSYPDAKGTVIFIEEKI